MGVALGRFEPGRVEWKERVKDMARYRALADIDLGIKFPYVQAGTILFDGPGGNIPNNWLPPPCAEPLDAAATTAYWNAGPGPTGPIVPHWVGLNVPPPVTWWKKVPGTSNPNVTYQLQGLGAALPPVYGGS
jgi:hypothetical protein